MKNETGARWMVVDNDSETLEIIADLLAALTSAEICAYRTTSQALEAFVAAPHAFELVVTDFEMPGMNGVDFRRHLQALSPKVKVLLMTGKGWFSEQWKARSGFSGLLRKPFSLAALKEAIEAIDAPEINRTGLAAAI